jgi:hypothetical protein
VGEAELPPAVKLEVRVELVVEGLPVGGLAPGSSVGRIASHRQAPGNHPEKPALVVVALHGEGDKVFAGLRGLLGKKLDLEFSQSSNEDYFGRGGGLPH